MNRKGRIAVTGAILAGVSYVAGILTAPKSGRETRKDINKAAHRAKTEAERRLKTAHSELNDALEQLSAQAKKGKDKVNTELDAAVAKAEEVKKKTRELISALHEGEAADNDLDEAVKEVKAAIKHLKSFAQK